MSVKQSDYETLLSAYSSRDGAIALLKQYRPYLELLPSMRRPIDSAIAIPLPVVRIPSLLLSKETQNLNPYPLSTTRLPCDLAILTCDPEWQIKMGAEILVFIHRPQEDFSNLLSRWRLTQVWLDKDYQWLMPSGEEHMLSEGANKIYPLFVVFENTLERIKQGLAGASLPFVVQANEELSEYSENLETLSTQE
ncbi:MAG: hypothetical protein QNJ54_13190 [Prochloraceae cyanobacterium]|nr:hypothetical protein [Prochloraceae cyanobacterium]